MEDKKVKQTHYKSILDIPNIENLLGEHAEFECYDFDDKIRCYSIVGFQENESIGIQIICSEKEPIFRDESFDDLLNLEETVYFSISYAKTKSINGLLMPYVYKTDVYNSLIEI